MSHLFESGFTDISEDVLNDILIELNSRNSRQLDEIDSNCINLTKFRCSSGVVLNIITICEVLKVDDSVKYHSIELFDKLLIHLVCDTKRVFLETTQRIDEEEMPFQWTSIEEKLKKQMHLRAVTCVVISAKLLNTSNELNMSEIQKFLRKSGYKYSLKNLNNSEQRVLGLLNFKLMVNSIDIYVETLLAVLKHNIIGFDSCIQSFVSIATELIDLYYICRNSITRNAFKIISNRLSLNLNTNEEELEMEKLCANKMLISSAIIASIPILIDVSIHEQLINELSEICGIADHLIIDMSHAILTLICDH